MSCMIFLQNCPLLSPEGTVLKAYNANLHVSHSKQRLFPIKSPSFPSEKQSLHLPPFFSVFFQKCISTLIFFPHGFYNTLNPGLIIVSWPNIHFLAFHHKALFTGLAEYSKWKTNAHDIIWLGIRLPQLFILNRRSSHNPHVYFNVTFIHYSLSLKLLPLLYWECCLTNSSMYFRFLSSKFTI